MAEADRKDFFISYNQGDRLWAEWIAFFLEGLGYTTVYQHRDFPDSLTASERDPNFIAKMDQALRESRCTLALPRKPLTTPAEPARAADQTAAFGFDGPAAVGAGAHGVQGGLGWVHLGHVGQHLGDGVGAGEHLGAVLPVGAGAADAGDLFDDGVDLDPGA